MVPLTNSGKSKRPTFWHQMIYRAILLVYKALKCYTTHFSRILNGYILPHKHKWDFLTSRGKISINFLQKNSLSLPLVSSRTVNTILVDLVSPTPRVQDKSHAKSVVHEHKSCWPQPTSSTTSRNKQKSKLLSQVVYLLSEILSIEKGVHDPLRLVRIRMRSLYAWSYSLSPRDYFILLFYFLRLQRHTAWGYTIFMGLLGTVCIP